MSCLTFLSSFNEITFSNLIKDRQVQEIKDPQL